MAIGFVRCDLKRFSIPHKLNLFISPKKSTKTHDIHHFEAESELVKTDPEEVSYKN